MKKLLLVALSAGMVACGTQKNVENANPMEYANSITSSELKEQSISKNYQTEVIEKTKTIESPNF